MRNLWAIASVVIGIIAVILSLPFIPDIPLLACPFGVAAMALGAIGLRRARAMADSVSAARAWWGMGLGCAATIVETITTVALVSILITALAAIFKR